MRREHWYPKVPETYRNAKGIVKPISPNHWKPRFAVKVEHAHTANEELVYKFLKKHQNSLPGNLGGIVRSLSVSKIAKGLDMHVETVRNQLRGLQTKHSIIAWNSRVGTAEARRRGDHGKVTAWRLPLYADVLAARRSDPLIGTTGAKQTYFWCFGPGRRFLTPEEVSAWGLEEVHVEKFGVRAAVLGATEAETGPAPAAAPAPTATPSPPGVSATGEDMLPPEIKEYLKAITHNHCTPEVGREIVATARRQAEALHASISDQEILDLLKRIRKNARSGGGLRGPYFRQAIAGQVEWWIESRAAERAKADDAAPRIDARERESRIGSIQEWLKMMETPDPDFPDLPATLSEWVAAADPAEVEEARERRAGMKRTG